MFRHFTEHLNVKKILYDLKPKVVVECGAEKGKNTVQLLSLGLDVTTITDGERLSDDALLKVAEEVGVCIDGRLSHLKWINGISYEELKKFDPDSIDFCSIDTDHNYWTLKKELEALNSRLKVGGVIILHDMEVFSFDHGEMGGYTFPYPYPPQISMHGKGGKSLHHALIEFLYWNPGYRIVQWTSDACGAAQVKKQKI